MVARLLDGRWIVVTAGVAAITAGFAVAHDPLITIAAMVLIVGCLLVLFMPEAMLLALIAAFPWQGYLGYPSETISLVKVLGALVVVAFVVRLVQRELQLTVPPTGYAVIAFVLLATISFIASSGAPSGLLSYYLFAAFFFLVVNLMRERADVTKMLRTLVLSVAAAALVALVQFVGGQTDRASGPIGDPNDFAFLMATVLPLAAYLIFVDRRWRSVWVACVPVIFAAMLATLSRGALVALGAMFLWAILTRRIKFGSLLVAAGVVIAVFVAGLLLWGPLINERLQQKGAIAAENVASRQALWDGAFHMWMDNPLTGVGPQQFGVESPNYVHDNPVLLQDPVVHNTYLQILAEEGGPALLAFLAFLAGSWVSLMRARRRFLAHEDRDGASLATAVEAALVIAIVAGFFLTEDAALPFWFLGALAALAPMLAPRGVPTPSPARAPEVEAPALQRRVLQPGS